MSSLLIHLDLQLFSQEKTEKATPKKKTDSRKKGEVAKSMEIPSALILLMCFFGMLMLGNYFQGQLIRLFTASFNDLIFWELTTDSFLALINQLIVFGILFLAPLFGIAVLIALLANYAQVGFLLTGDPLKLKFSKLDPIKGFKNIVSLRSVVNFFKTLFKLLIVSIVIYIVLWGERENFIGLSFLPLEGIVSYVSNLTMTLGISIAILLVILAIFDYMYQKYDYEKKLRMSKQDIKDEFKKTEGDPLVKSKIRDKQRRMAMQRMMQEVPTADVVITNPTHYSIALKYDAEEMNAPRVVAKGLGFVALKIREIASEHGVALVENRPLAHALYAEVEVEEEVPAELFQSVAEVLAFVYRMDRRHTR